MKKSYPIKLNKEQIAEIADSLLCGLRSYYNIVSYELIFLPDIYNSFEDFPDEIADDYKKIENNWDEYIEFAKMESWDSFRIMEDFTYEVNDTKLKEQLIRALNKPKPFRHFKFIIDESGEFRERWFEFRLQRMIDWVTNQIDAHNEMVESQKNNLDQEK